MTEIGGKTVHSVFKQKIDDENKKRRAIGIIFPNENRYHAMPELKEYKDGIGTWELR